MTAATALVRGEAPYPELAREAVEQALDKAGLRYANAVLLYLSADFSRDTQLAVQQAARGAGCLQVAGCTCTGMFTETGWVLEETAAAAMVFGGDVFLKQARPGEEPLLSLSVPGALDLAWLECEEARYGAVASDADGNGPYRVWSNGRVQGNGRCGLIFDGVRLRLGISQGARPLSEPMAITQVDGHDILTVADQPALANLAHHLPQLERELSRLPLHLFMAGITFGAPEHALEEGRYHLLPLISANADDRSVTVPVLLSPGDRLFWALRQPPAAEQDMRLTLDRLGADTLDTPEFGLLFSCQGRGAGFYGGDDRDLALLTERYPGLPLIGFYGNGEIAHLNGMNRLLQYSAVLGLAYV